jgi:hypothetical protein
MQEQLITKAKGELRETIKLIIFQLLYRSGQLPEGNTRTLRQNI